MLLIYYCVFMKKCAKEQQPHFLTCFCHDKFVGFKVKSVETNTAVNNIY